MTKLSIQSPTPYTLAIGHGLLDEPVQRPKALLYDQAVWAYADQLADRLEVPHRMGLAGGEGSKTIEVFGRVLSWLAGLGLPRDTRLYVVGGGTLSDLGGYVAAAYLRGVEYVSFPTTTLAMVDASVGGKTGLNLSQGKNLVGAFHFPKAVYADLNTLSTLPWSTFKEGLVEAFKHGLISGEQSLLELGSLHPAWQGLEAYLARAVQVKIAITELDPTEQGERRKLNLGHTLGHALEAASEHRLSHGAAVAYGLLYAAIIGKKLGGADLVPRVQQLIEWLSPIPAPRLSWDQLAPYIARDKKKLGSKLHWVLPMGLGELRVCPVEEPLLQEAYRDWLMLCGRG
jgi:3-dehydroquinate synthase